MKNSTAVVEWKLKPCPFCGSQAELHRLGGPGSTYAWVECSHCHADMPFCLTFEQAAEMWNRRVPA
jgi:Lar family restriction alleviation protein